MKTSDAIQPNWSPHGYRIAYWGITAGGRRDIFTVGAKPDRDDGQPVAVTNDLALDWNPVWSPGGEYLYFLSDRGGLMNLWRVAIDEKSGPVRREPEAVTMPTPRMGSFTFSADGRALAFAHADRVYNLWSAPYDAAQTAVTGAPEPAISGTHYIANFSFSPKGAQLVYDTRGAPEENIWVMNRDGSGRRRLNAGSAQDRSPSWSPVSDEIAFFSDRSGRFEVWLIRADGSGLRQLTETTGPGLQAPDWSHDGLRIFCSRQDGTALTVPVRQGLIRDPEVIPTTIGGGSTLLFRASPSGSCLTIASFSLSKMMLRCAGERNTEVMIPYPGRRPYWLPDGSGLIYSRDGKCLRYDAKTRVEKTLFDIFPAKINEMGFAGGRILFHQNRGRRRPLDWAY